MKKLLSLIVTSALLVTACNQGESEAQEGALKIPSVKVETLGERMVDQTIEFTGNIEPLVKNNISSAAAQRIDKIHAEVGTRVKKGQLLVEMEDVNYVQARIQLENLKADLARTEALYKAGGISEQQYQQLKTQVNVSEESIANLAKNTKLLSPIDGIVTHKNFDNGDIAAGQPILVVMQMQPVKILINISEEFFPQVKIGTPATIRLDIYPDKSFAGKVMLIHPTIDATTRSFQAELRIENPSLLIRPGMFARAIVDFGSKERLVVPDVAVIKQPGTNDRYVYVLEGDKVFYRKVELGRRVGDIYEVVGGIALGDRVVVAGHTGLMDNVQVRVVTGGPDLFK
ncbi:MAG: efflux RND transporter periplasmic adaptor subunit [Rikenellaceae bacterium]|nr:efflux RND transporter periplasmic adaptor subunit [Rikenellaceae bacterium]